MKLTGRLKTGMIVGGLALALGTSGCQTTQNRGGNETLLGLSLMSLGIQKKNPASVAVGRGLVTYGSAQAGRSEVNVNVYTGGGSGSNNQTLRETVREVDRILGRGNNRSNLCNGSGDVVEWSGYNGKRFFGYRGDDGKTICDLKTNRPL